MERPISAGSGILKPAVSGLSVSAIRTSFPKATPQAKSAAQEWSGFDDADQREKRAT
jgi:hypothetical protein